MSRYYPRLALLFALGVLGAVSGALELAYFRSGGALNIDEPVVVALAGLTRHR